MMLTESDGQSRQATAQEIEVAARLVEEAQLGRSDLTVGELLIALWREAALTPQGKGDVGGFNGSDD